MPKAKVVRFDGEGPLPVPGEPVQNVVEVLEELLEMAKSGEIVGIIGAQVYTSKEGYLRPASNFHGGYVDSSITAGALQMALWEMFERMNH